MSESIFYGQEPQSVLRFFEEITKIPHPSYNEKKLSDYLVDFAKKRNLEVIQDEANNVIIKKPATANMENKPGIILQSHMDMVAIADKDMDFDFSKDSIEAYVDGDLIKAKGTTLGADDGIGIAMTLAILDSDTIKHPGIEAVITTSEEVGLDGAKAIDISQLSYKRMINIDSEDQDELIIGCAGGCRAGISFEYDVETAEGDIYEISVEGLMGGHSGTEIDKKHPNANNLIGRVLYEIAESIEFGLVKLNGGLRDNAISTEALATIVIDKDSANELKEMIEKLATTIAAEYVVTEPDFKILVRKVDEGTREVLSANDFYKLMYLINMAPVGVLKMSQQLAGIVDTSSNLGVLNVDNKKVDAGFCLRSNQDSSKEWLVHKYGMLAAALEADIEVDGDYPAWENEGISDFARSIADEYKKITGDDMKIQVIHAGLECALFYKKIKGLDAVSIGPNVSGAHTTSENVSISSIKVVWELLNNILAM